jgi:hypothetical protein
MILVRAGRRGGGAVVPDLTDMLSRSNVVGGRISIQSEALIEAKAWNPLVTWDFLGNDVELLDIEKLAEAEVVEKGVLV